MIFTASALLDEIACLASVEMAKRHGVTISHITIVDAETEQPINRQVRLELQLSNTTESMLPVKPKEGTWFTK